MPNQGRAPAHLPDAPSVRRAGVRIALVLGLAGLGTALAVPAAGHPLSEGPREPRLVARAVLPVETYAPGPPAGARYGAVVNPPVKLPTPSQPVEGFSAMVAGRRHGEYLAMPDNGFGNKANSVDFLIRAYYVTPHFKTARGGSGGVDVDLKHYIEFRDPHHRIGFPIVNEATSDRLLTGSDIDPESIAARPRRRPSGWATSSVRGSCTSAAGVCCSTLRSAVPGFMSPQNPLAQRTRRRSRSPDSRLRGHVDLDQPQVPLRGLRGSERRGSDRRSVPSDDPRVQHPREGLHRPVVGATTPTAPAT